MNLNKLTKAELMLKLKKIQEKSNNNNLLAKLLLFNSLINKITLIALLIKTFRKYSMLRKVFMFLNMIIVSIFGISLMDIYGLTFLASIIETIRSTYIYSWFSGLLSSKEIETPSRLKSINQTSTGNEKSSTMIEGFKKLVIKEEPQIEEDTPIYKNKWVIIAAILLISGLTWWYFGDSIKQFSTTGYSEFKRKPKTDEIDPTGHIELPIQYPPIERTWWTKIKDFFDLSKWRNNTPPNNKPEVLFDAQSPHDIELVNQTRHRTKLDFTNKDPITIEADKIYNDWDNPKSPSECSINHYFPEVDQVNTELSNNEILQHLTGEANQRFDLESNEIIGQINTFLDYHDRDVFPSDIIKSSMYKAISAKLLSMTILNSIRYNDWLKRTDVAPNLVRFNLLENSIKSIEEQSDTYAEIVNATALEQEAWSDDGTRASTPRMDEVPDIKQETPKLESKPLETVSTLRDKWEESAEVVKGKFNQLFASIKSKQTEMKVETDLEQPIASSSKVKLDDLSNNQEQIKPNSDESDNSFERYFPDPNESNEVKSSWKNSPLLEDKTQDLPKIVVSENPEQTPEDTTILDRGEEILESPKAKFNALFSSINALRDGATRVLKNVSTDKTLDSGGVSENIQSDNPIKFEGKSIPVIKPSKIDSPIPQNPSVSNLFDDTMALFDDEPDNTLIEDTPQEANISQDSVSTDVIDSWDKIKFNIWDKSKQVNIQFGELWRDVDSIHFATNDNHLVVEQIDNLGNDGNKTHSNDAFVWDRRTTSDFNSELKEIIIKDLSGKTHSIYRNDKFFK
jgi:hypothetical protein